MQPAALPGSTSGTDRANVNLSFSRNWDHLAGRFVGTGHPDMTRHAWLVNHHRDSLAAWLGHADQLAYLALAEGESVGRVRYTMMERMMQPCGPPPPDKADAAAAAEADAAAAAAAAAVAPASAGAAASR